MKTSVEDKIKYLESQGWTVELEHQRRYTNHTVGGRPYLSLEAKGGFTRAKIIASDEKVIIKSEAICSIEDNYNRKIGANIALGRLIKELKDRWQ
jgi:hypothetical protein